MKLVVRLKRKTPLDDHAALPARLEHPNDAAGAISQVAWEPRTFGHYALHKAVYYEIKARFRLTAQLVVRLIAKVADTYKLVRRRLRLFRATAPSPTTTASSATERIGCPWRNSQGFG